MCLEKYIPSEHTRTLTETFTYTHIEEFLPTEQTVKALNHVLVYINQSFAFIS